MSAETPPGYTTPIPAKIMTPDRVETQIGPLVFDDGRPTPDTADTLYDFVDLMRGVQVFLDCIPAASLEAMRAGLEDHGIEACHQVLVADQLLDSTPLFLTGNTDTVYATTMLDLDRDGPTVVEIPAGCGPGTVNDAWFRFVVDMGAPGPDRGQGGRYLIVPEDHEGDLPDGYFVARTPSRVNWLILRGFLVDGRTDAAIDMFREGLRVYPLSQQDGPPAMQFSSFSGTAMNTIHANDFHFYTEVARVIDREPVGLIDAETRGTLASIGIRKGRPFEPDDRMRTILDEAVRIGNGTARATAMAPRDPGVRIYSDRQWQTGFVGADHEWMGGDPANGRDHDARTMFFYFATVNTPAMALEMVGAGSQYAISFRDSAGEYLDGAARYRLTIPAGVPAKDFWSVVVYDPQTRSELQTGQPFPSRNDKRDSLKAEPDGSILLHFGPDAPVDAPVSNWIQTVPGKGWFAILRLYGPLEEWFDQSWKPGDIEPVS
jgi:hypothetical protein